MNSDPHAVIPKAQKATVNILNAAARHNDIKRFVMTSSSSAAIVPKPNVKGITIDQSAFQCHLSSIGGYLTVCRLIQ